MLPVFAGSWRHLYVRTTLLLLVLHNLREFNLLCVSTARSRDTYRDSAIDIKVEVMSTSPHQVMTSSELHSRML